MKNTLTFIQLFLSTLLVFLILLQPKGTGFTRSFSAVSFTRRGIEKIVFRLTFIIAFLFVVISILQLFV